MPQTKDIIDDEPETTEDGGEEQEQKPAAPPSTVDPATTAAINQLTAQVSRLVAGAAGAGKQTQAEVSELEMLLAELSRDHDPAQVAILYRFAEAIEKKIEKRYQGAVQQDKVGTHQQQCRAALTRELDALAEKYGEAKVEYSKPQLYQEVLNVVDKDPQFANELAKFNRGEVPNFKKAVQLVSDKWAKEFGMMKDGKSGSDQLDTKNSRTKPSAAISKDGKVDVTKLTDYEREVYTATLNVTKNKDIALKALKEIGGAR